jgi:hypothetical protein
MIRMDPAGSERRIAGGADLKLVSFSEKEQGKY